MKTTIGTITVKFSAGTNVARFKGQRASSTASEMQAAYKVADKVLGGKSFDLEKVVGVKAYNVIAEQ